MKISESTFTIVGNGFAEGPSQALRDYLLLHNAKRITMIAHPLVSGGDGNHIVTVYESGNIAEKKHSLPNEPPYTYLIDPFTPLSLPKDDYWFGFNNLACLRGIARRRAGRTKVVVYWAVDFVPNRFGKNIATRVYDLVDKYVCKNVDMRVELTQPALEKRPVRLNIDPKQLSRSMVVPMGAWLGRTPKATYDNWEYRRLIYMGHLVERQGVTTFILAVAELLKRGVTVTADIVGGGPLLDDLRSLAQNLGIDKAITFHGFVDSHKDVEAILADATVAAAPYKHTPDNFTQFSDPGKIKAYMGASLPIVLTDVPAIARELKECGVAKVVDDSPIAFADALQGYIEDKRSWSKSHVASAKKATEFDWSHILKSKLNIIGLE